MKIPHLILKGEPKERGIKYGAYCQNLIQKSLSKYKELFDSNATRGDISWRKMKKIANAFYPGIKEFSPELLEEIEGIAEGAKIDFWDLLTMNCRSELITLAIKKPYLELDECTTGCILPEASESNTVILLQNWDIYSWIGEFPILLEIHSKDEPDIFAITEAGQLARYGMNRKGLALGVNGLPGYPEGKEIGLPSVFVRRKFLMQDNWADGINIILKAKHTASVNYLISYGEGDAISLECFLDKTYLLEPDNGIITHSNHFLHPALYENNLKGEIGSSIYRHRRLRNLLKKNLPAISMENAQNAMKDHFAQPKSICRHVDMTKHELKRVKTIASVIMDVTEKKLWLCKGNPCQGKYVEYYWSR